MGKTFFLYLAVAFGFVCVCAASDDNPCHSHCGIADAWSEFNVFEIRMSVSGRSDQAHWRGRFDRNTDDIQIDVENSDGGKIKRGKILMVGGRVMAVQGPIIEHGYEIDALDAPVLEYQLVLKLLSKALPNGPAQISGKRDIDLKEEKEGISLATPSAGGAIPEPWSLRGELTLEAPDIVNYKLTLRWRASNSAEISETTLVGELSKSANAKIDDSMSLEGWNLFGVGVQTRKTDSGTIFDYGAGPAIATYRTVADIRKKIARDDYPGEPDGSKDFTGFWKEDCEQGFGLQILHHGPHGEYAVTFCGPGGCGDPAEERPTFITKDPNYRVISESEIKTRSGDGWSTYHKCTTDTHPVLKYNEH
jgi:hypothetical protein